MTEGLKYVWRPEGRSGWEAEEASAPGGFSPLVLLETEVTYETPGIQGLYFALPIAPYTLVIAAWGVVTTDWESVEGTAISCQMDLTSDAVGQVTVYRADDIRGAANFPDTAAIAEGFIPYSGVGGSSVFRPPTFMLNGPNGGLYMNIFQSLTLTAGVMRVYALTMPNAWT